MPKHVWLVELEIVTDEGTVPELTEGDVVNIVYAGWRRQQVKHALPYVLAGVEVVGGPKEV